ncbi:MAG: Na+/H+ antiporter subunit D, partial [Actinobacteria bacterium]|nr:Na+/H+ antiporter subunit D [Actinomycetota bacterium]
TGTGALSRLGGLLHRTPVVAGLFLLPALSLAGLPPFSGFVAKLALVQAGLAVEAHTIVAISLLVSLLTLFSMTKIWAGVFWGAPEEAPPLEAAAGDGRLSSPALMVAPTAALVVLSLVIAVAAAPLWDLSERAAATLVDPAPYVEAVLP